MAGSKDVIEELPRQICQGYTRPPRDTNKYVPNVAASLVSAETKNAKGGKSKKGRNGKGAKA